MSDKKYPYIGESISGKKYLVYSKSSGFKIDKGTFHGQLNADMIENITRERLANTYGKCESQEHANFICELADSHGIRVTNDYNESFGRVYFVCEKGSLSFFEALCTDLELIHLPLPPKEKPMIETKPTYTKEMHERGELPPVGSYFVMNDIPNHVSYKKFEGLPCKVLALTEHEDGVVVTFNNEREGFGALWHHEGMGPIPTIEYELACFLDKTAGLTHGERVIQMLKKFNITPKGE